MLGVIVLDNGPLHGVKRALVSAPANGDSTSTSIVLVTPRPDHFTLEPGVTIVGCSPNATPGTMRNLGLHATEANHLLFLDAECTLLPGAIDEITEAHRLGYAMVTGAVEPDVGGPPGSPDSY